MIAIHAREPVLNLLRSRTFFEWFDAVGVDDIPAVFAGEEFERLEIKPESEPTAPEVLVAVVTPVDDLVTLRAHVRRTRADLRRAGIRRVVMFRAFDDPLEVMMLLQIDDEDHAAHWLEYSELAAEWLREAGIGAYPPVFTGRFGGMLRIDTADGPITDFRPGAAASPPGPDVGRDLHRPAAPASHGARPRPPNPTGD